MRILIDECLPKRLKREFTEHAVHTVPEMGWAGKKNGELLRLMSGEFDVFVTADQNLQYQQNAADLAIGFIVLAAKNNKLETLQLLIPQALAALETIEAGDFVVIYPVDEQ